MEYALLDTALLEQDILNIKYYSEEENKILFKINNELMNINDNYKSINTASIISNIDNFSNSINELVKKRDNYQKTLNDVINQYYFKRYYKK